MSSSVVVFSPHADDETLGMGGTVAKMALAGFRVWVVCCAEHSDPGRFEELAAACTMLGAEKPVLLSRYVDARLSDGELDQNRRRLVQAMDSVLAELEPELVFLPYPSPHQDHRAVYEAGVAACRVSLDAEHWWVPNVFVYGEAVAEVDLYPTGLRWSVFVDISGLPLERKMDAIRQHRSQEMPAPYPSNAEFLAAEAVQVGGLAMMQAAECFAPLRVSR